MHFQPLLVLGLVAALGHTLVIPEADTALLIQRDDLSDLYSSLLDRRGKAPEPAKAPPPKPDTKPSAVFKQPAGGKHDTPVPKGCSGAYCDHGAGKVMAAYGDNLKEHADHKLSHPAVGTAFDPHSGTPADRKKATTKQRYEATKNTPTEPGKARDEFPWASAQHKEPHTSVKLLPAKESHVESSVMAQANAQAHKYRYPVQFKDNRSRRRRDLEFKRELMLEILTQF
ncbi:hypothetical protein MMC13_003495 [Lambiella insularis]|nr:hypothetical protein [Lambiella insularis]